MINAPTYEGHNIDGIKIGGEWFIGIGYQGLLNVNTKTYVEEPTRSNDGSIPNINDHDTFIVPRCKVNFKYFKIEDYQRLCNVINSANEFPVIFFDKQFGDWVTHKMYCEPEEMYKIFNIGMSVLGVLDYEISFIGTLNDLSIYSVDYNANGGTAIEFGTYSEATTYNLGDRVKNVADGITTYYEYINGTSGSGHLLTETEYWSVLDSSILSTATYTWGSSTLIKTGTDLTNFFTAPTDKTFLGWNTKADGTGWNYLPNTNASIFENMTLYAKWGDA